MPRWYSSSSTAEGRSSTEQQCCRSIPVPGQANDPGRRARMGASPGWSGRTGGGRIGHWERSFPGAANPPAPRDTPGRWMSERPIRRLDGCRRNSSSLGALRAVAVLAAVTASVAGGASMPGVPPEREVLLGGLCSLTRYLAGNAAGVRFVAAIEDTRLEPALDGASGPGSRDWSPRGSYGACPATPTRAACWSS